MAVLTGCTSGTASTDSASDLSASSDTISATVTTASETVETDLVVIGSGMAGLTTAVTAMQEGCQSVVLLEKNSYLGGSSNFAEGVFGNGDRYQQQQGYGPYDLSEILAEEVNWSHGVVKQELLMDAMEGSREYVNWLLDQGVSFATILDAGTGRMVLHIYDGGNGASAVKVLGALATDTYGVDLRTSARATALLMDGDKVTGVQADVDGTVTDFKANTVVIASGGIGANTDLMDEYTKLDAGKWNYLGDKAQMGDGLKLAESTAHGRGKNVCAQNMWITVEGCVDVKDSANMVGGMEGSNIWINEDAKRFCDESIAQQFFIANNTVVNQGFAWSVFDQDHVAFFAQNGTTCMWSGFSMMGKPITDVQEALDKAAADSSVKLVKADTLEELADGMGVDAKAFKSTVDAWNAEVAAGVDVDFGKTAPYMAAVKTGPFYAAKLQSTVLATIGGVRVNRAGQVTAPNGTPVEGLYAAGVVSSGFSGEVYGMSAAGITQGSAIYLGRLAGKAAAARS